MSMRYEIRLSGEGGQGLVLAGKILAEAAAIFGGLNATQSQSYGPEARGGVSRSEVIISDGDIDFPKAIEVDLLLALTQQAYDAYTVDVKPGGIVVVDSDQVTKLDAKKKVTHVSTKVFDLAQQELGRSLFGNMIALGLIAGMSKIVPDFALRTAIASRVPSGTEEKNLRAFELGLEIAKKHQSG